MSGNISLKQLRAFLAVAESGSFTEGARKLNVTQSALSLLVKSLEAELGLRLLDRTTRRVEISAAGREFQPLARKVLDDLQSVIRGAAEVVTVQRGVVRMGATEAVACALVAPAIAAYQKDKPSVEVRLVDTPIHTMLLALKNGEVDYVIGPTSVRESALDANVEAIPFLVSPFAAFCPKNHPLSHLETVRWGELARHPLIVHVSSWQDPQMRDSIAAGRAKQGLDAPAETRQVSNLVTGMSLAAAGLGVMLAPQYLSPLAKDLGLSACVLIRPVMKRVITLYARKAHALTPAAEHFLAFFRDFAHERGLAM